MTDGIRMVEWRKDNKTILSSNSTEVNHRYKLLASGSLSIDNVTKSDNGTYTCSVSNKAGEDVRHIKVEVQEKVSFHPD